MGRSGNACEHGLCDDESLCSRCRYWGYGAWPSVTERLGFLLDGKMPWTPRDLEQVRQAMADAIRELNAHAAK